MNYVVSYIVPLMVMVLSNNNPCHGTDVDSTRHNSWYVPAFVPVQFAGNIGMLSGGVGYNLFNRKWQVSLVYGYVPSSIANKEIHLVTVKNRFPFYRLTLIHQNKRITPYTGITTTLETGGLSYITFPSHFPHSYYDRPDAIHFTLFVGLNTEIPFENRILAFHGLDFFIEAGIPDIFIWYKISERDIRFNQVFSLALGVNFLLK